MVRIEIERTHKDFGFEGTDSAGQTIKMDTTPDSGGDNYGVRPMQAVLFALGGCSGIDVISILKKQRQQVESYKMIIDGEREKGVEPSLWKTISIKFILKGNIDMEKAKRACQLSIDKYCSVAETLRRAGATITWEVEVNN